MRAASSPEPARAAFALPSEFPRRLPLNAAC